MRRCLLLALCCTLLAAPAASAVPDGGWCKRSTKVVARNAQVVVYLGGRDDSGRAVCARYRRRRPLIVGEEGSTVRLGGRFVFVAAIDPEEGRESGDSYLYATLFNVARRQRRHRWQFFQFSGATVPMAVHGARLLRSGSVAYAVTGVHAEGEGAHVTEIHATRGPFQELLARGEDVDARSLRYEDGRLFWTEGGREHSAAFR